MAITRALFASGAIAVASAYLYGRYLHQSLASQVRHRNGSAVARIEADKSGQLESLPKELLDNPNRFRIVHDIDEKSIPDADLFNDSNMEQLFTKLVRRNMSAFANLPQSWMMRTMARTTEQRQSFQKAHLASIDYKEGDLFCGFYRVIRRSPAKVEVKMEPPPGAGALDGRLVISLNERADEVLLRTETLQWIAVDSQTILPLERAPVRFMHETASWWLLVSGAKYLQSLV